MMLDAALLLGLGGPIEPAPGEPAPVELRWQAVPGCPDRAAVEQALGALVRADSYAGGAQVSGRLEGELGSYALHLEIALASQREVRELRAHDCTLLARAGVLVAAVTLDALATVASVAAMTERPAALDRALDVPLPPDPATAPERPRARPRPDVARLEPVTEARPGPTDARTARPRSATLGASAGASVGMTPGLAGGLEAELAWRLGSVRLAVSGFHWFSRSTELRPEVGIEAALSGAALRACVVFGRTRLEAPMCFGPALAAMHGGGEGAAVQRRDAAALYVGLAAGAGLAVWVAPRFALQARVEGVLGLRRPAMALRLELEPREAFRMPPVGVQLWVGPLVRVW